MKTQNTTEKMNKYLRLLHNATADLKEECGAIHQREGIPEYEELIRLEQSIQTLKIARISYQVAEAEAKP